MYPTPFMNGKRLNSFLRLAVLGLCGVLRGGCSSDGDATDGSGSCSVSGQTKGAIVTFGTFARIQSEEGLVSEGLNLDDVTTNEGDVTGCAKPDFTTPEGTEGIDNQFGLILKLMEEVGGAENLDALITGAFSSGQLAYMMAVEGIDDP